MNKKYKITFFVLLALAGLLFFVLTFFSPDMVVLNPKGFIGIEQRDLLVISTLLMLIVVIPVFVFLFYFIWKYRASNPHPKYDPEMEDSVVAEIIWWGFPCLIVFVLSIITWYKTHELDPFKPLVSPVKPIHIQVVALQWKWLFIYPEEKIATVNYIQFPKATPINFEITSDAPMNAFWIPELGGMIFAMAGMNSKLHLIADEEGHFDGSSAHISGTGFAGMRFTANSSSEEDYQKWLQTVKQSQNHLDLHLYQHLVEPSFNNAVETYQLATEDLYNQIIKKYMVP
jgi:cytochrome o ubiquinol oxidase subunit 2